MFSLIITLLHTLTHTRTVAEFSARSVGSAVVAVVDWFKLGRQLGLPHHTLEEVRLDYTVFGTARQRNEILQRWLTSDPAASWQTLCAALKAMGETALADHISCCCCCSTDTHQ